MADGWAMGMALLWKYAMVREYRAKFNWMLAVAWAMGKALMSALELVRDKGPS